VKRIKPIENKALELPTFVVGITTCYCKDQILETLKSLRASKNVPYFKIIIVSDRGKVSTELRNKIESYDVTLVENDEAKSAQAKQIQILNMIDEEIIIQTQDDVLFDTLTIFNIVKSFSEPGITFVGVKNEPLPEKSLVEAGISVGLRICNKIARNWNNGDNYLACLGRIMAFRTTWMKETYINMEAVSLDAFLYLENKRMGGKYVCIWDTPVYFRSPQNILEHMRKSSRFQYSYIEMKSYQRFENLDSEYKIPLSVALRAMLSQLLQTPVPFIIYIGIYGYTRLFKIPALKCLYANWEVDISTKDITVNSQVQG
jgi:hypothetical protein